MNKYLEKIAAKVGDTPAEDSFDPRYLQGATGVVAANAGVGLAKSQYDRGNLTGRETLWHGSSEGRISKIREQGLRPNIGGGVSDTVGLQAHNKNLVFTDKRKSMAKMYASQQDNISKGSFNPNDIPGRKMDSLKAQLPGKVGKSRLAEVNLPTWKPENKSAWNPELRHQLRNPMRNFNAMAMGVPSDKFPKHLMQTYQANVHTTRNPEGISTDYIKGSKTYKGNSLGEIREYIKANPKRFAGGVGKGVAGLGLAAAGAGLVAHAFRNKDDDAKTN